MLALVTDHDHHAAANAEQVRLLQEELAVRIPEQKRRLPGFAAAMTTALRRLGILAGVLLESREGRAGR